MKFKALTDFISIGVGEFKKGKEYEIPEDKWDAVSNFAQAIYPVEELVEDEVQE